MTTEQLLALLRECRRFVSRYENCGDNWAFQLAEQLDELLKKTDAS